MIIPPHPGDSVCCGAVLYGMNPAMVNGRIARLTIGIGMADIWNETIHNQRASYIDEDGVKRCSNCFNGFVRKGDWIHSDMKVSHVMFPPSKWEIGRIKIYTSPATNPIFVDEPGVELLGFMLIDLPDVGKPSHERGVEVIMKFGGPTFEVSATYVRTQQSVSAGFKLFGIPCLLFLFSLNF